MAGIATKLYHFGDSPDENPAERIHETETAAREYAVRRSQDVRGRVDLCRGPALPPFARYVGGIDTMTEEALMATVLESTR